MCITNFGRMIEISNDRPPAPGSATVNLTRLRRHSAGGQALHHWDCEGKLTTIHVVYEMSSEVQRQVLIEAVQTRLLEAFPRLRGYVDGSDWLIPPTVDAEAYVEDISLSTTADGSSAAQAVQAFVAKKLSEPLPPTRMWQVCRIRVDNAAHFLLWRFSHTVADGVVLTKIMSQVLCDPPPASADGAKAGDVAARPVTASWPGVTRAGFAERAWCVLIGLVRVATLLCWRSDQDCAIRLGPARWKAGGGKTAARARRIGVAEPIDVEAAKLAARRKGVTVNDLLLAAVGQGIRAYLQEQASGQPHGPRRIPERITAVVVVNPRPEMPQAEGPSAVLERYSRMAGQGCDVTLAFVPLPCGEGTAGSLLRRVAASTRQVKLSPETLLLRLAAMVICRLFGVRLLVFIYTLVVSKFTTYFSNVVAPQRPGTFCTVPIRSIYFTTASLDFGTSFSFLSYNGDLTLCCAADALTVPEPQRLSAHVHNALLCQVDDPPSNCA